MTKASTLKRQITDAQASLKALRSDRPKIVALFDKHTAQLTAAKRDGVDYEQLAELQAKQDAFASVLTQHDRDIQLLEADIEALQKKHDLQATGERFAVVKGQHEKLMTEYVGAVRESLNTVQHTLSAELKKRADIENARKEMEQLGLKLGIYQRSTSPYSRHPIVGTSFAPLYPSALPGLFDADYPELRTDKMTLSLLHQIADQDEVVTTGELRLTLAHREATRQAQLKEKEEAARARYLAAAEQSSSVAEGGDHAR